MKLAQLSITILGLCAATSSAVVVINELSGASPGRLIKWSGAGQPSRQTH